MTDGFQTIFRNLLLAICLLFAAISHAQENFKPGELLVKIRPGHELKEIQLPQLNINQAQLTGPTLGLYLIPIQGQHPVENLIAQLKQLPAVHYAEPNYYYQSVAPQVAGPLVQQWKKKRAKQKFYQRDFMFDLRLLLGSQFLPTNPGEVHAIFSVNRNLQAQPYLEELRLIRCHTHDHHRLSSVAIVSCMEYFRSLQISGMKLLATLNAFSSPFRSKALFDAIQFYDLMDIQFISVTTESALKQFPQRFNLSNIFLLSFTNSQTMPTTPFEFNLPENDVFHYEVKSSEKTFEPSQTARYDRDTMGTRLILNATTSNKNIIQNLWRRDPVALQLFTSKSGILLQDMDNDGMADQWEIENRLDPTDPSDAHLDPDFDSLTNADEFRLGTNIFSADSDEDSISDSDEIFFHNTNPLHFDSTHSPDTL